MNKRGEWDPGTLLRIIKYLVISFFVERVDFDGYFRIIPFVRFFVCEP